MHPTLFLNRFISEKKTRYVKLTDAIFIKLIFNIIEVKEVSGIEGKLRNYECTFLVYERHVQ